MLRCATTENATTTTTPTTATRTTTRAATRAVASRWAVALLSAALLGAVSAAPAAAAPAPVTTAAAAPTALQALDTVPVKGKATSTGYARSLFGQAWADVDRNGCDTRNDVLRRDLRDVVLKPGTHDCVVKSGTLPEPYRPSSIAFVRGVGRTVEIDHVVALGNAWRTGAQGWDTATRTRFANDPLNLLAVERAMNQQKKAADAATWLPPNTGYRCAYVARQVAVKARYGLWMTPAEHDAVARVLQACPAEPLPAG